MFSLIRFSLFLAVLALGLEVALPHAHAQVAAVVSSCNTSSFTAGDRRPLQMTAGGVLCTSTSGGGGGSVTQGTSPWVVSGAAGVELPHQADTGSPGATACATDTGSCSLNQLLQRLAQRLTTLNSTLNAPFQAAGALGAGSAIIGKVGIDQTTPGTTNAVQATNFPTGLTATGNALDINLKSGALLAGSAIIGKVGIDQTTPGTTNLISAGQNGTWTVQPGNTANTTPWLTQPVGGTSGGLSVLSKQVANNTTSFAVDASPGTLYGIAAYSNSSATIAYIKLYDAVLGSTTCGSGTPKDRSLIPANSNGAGYIWNQPQGVAYATAITACVTAGYGDSDTTAPAATTYIVNFYYK